MSSELMMEAAKLRLRLQTNARLRLEVLAALARVFREYRDPITDELLSTLILAVPEELLGEAPAGKMHEPTWTAPNPVPPVPFEPEPGPERTNPIPPPFRPISPPLDEEENPSAKQTGPTSRSRRKK